MALTVDPQLRTASKNQLAGLGALTSTESDRKRRDDIFLGGSNPLQQNINTQLQGLTSGLGAFDVAGERNLLEQQAQQSREMLARQFAISPESIQSGRSLRLFGTA